MGKQWARQEAKKNEVADFVNQIVDWSVANREKALGIAGGVIGVALLAGLYVHNRITARTTSWEKLAIAESYAYQGRPDAAITQIKAIEAEYPHSPAAGFGALFAGDIFFRQGNYKEAIASYQGVINDQFPKAAVPFAMSNTVASQEAAGDCKSAVESAQHFIDGYQDHFLAPQVHASLARCLEVLGQKDKAKSTYERMALLYPDTFWAQWAQARLKS